RYAARGNGRDATSPARSARSFFRDERSQGGGAAGGQTGLGPVACRIDRGAGGGKGSGRGLKRWMEGWIMEACYRGDNMNVYETSGRVEEQGQLHLAGVPFAPGTKVEVAISAKSTEDEKLTAARERMRELFATVKGFRMAPRFSREELYDRRCFR